MKRLFAVICACAVFGDGALGYGEHLEPEESIFTGIGWFNSYKSNHDYYVLVLFAFDKAHEADVKVRAVVIPSFEREYATGIKETNGVYKAFRLYPAIRLLEYSGFRNYKEMFDDPSGEGLAILKERLSDEEIEELREKIGKLGRSMPPDAQGIKIENCERPIKSELGQRIIRLWHDMLLRTAFPEELTHGADGVRYHFSMVLQSGQPLAGQTWSPPDGSNTGRLVNIAEALGQYCLSGDQRFVRLMEQEVQTLSDRLRN